MVKFGILSHFSGYYVLPVLKRKYRMEENYCCYGNSNFVQLKLDVAVGVCSAKPVCSLTGVERGQKLRE